jgi:hypothetical protein
MPSIISAGVSSFSASNVATPTSLTPTLPSILTTGDWIFCFTTSTSASATVATPSGWQSLCNVAGANGKAACFARVVDGTETAPTVTWSGLTTGTGGTPCYARLVNAGTGWLVSGGALTVDIVSGVSDQVADTTIMAAGASFTAVSGNTWVWAIGVRLDDVATGVVDAGGEPVAWTIIFGDNTTSGADMLAVVGYGLGPTAGSTVTTHTWTITGGTSVASSGVMIAIQLEPIVDSVDRHLYTRGYR